MSRADYDRIDAVNFSTLKALADSPAHYRARLATPVEETDAMRLGSAVHTLALEPHCFADDYAVWHGGRRAGKEYDAFVADLAGRTALTPDQMATALAMADSIRRAVGDLTRRGSAEWSVVWTDAETGIGCKARVDWCGPAGLIDLKTCLSTDPRAFAANAARYLYHAQMAWYFDGIHAATGETPTAAYLVGVEKSPPYDVGVFALDEHALSLGRVTYRRWLSRLAECRSRDEWPGRCSVVQPLTLPAWAFLAESLSPPDEDIPL